MRLAYLGIALVLASVTPALASELDPIIDRLHAASSDWSALRDSGAIQFRDSAASGRFDRAMRRLETSIEDLESMAGGGNPPDNHRGRAVVLIRERVHSSYASAIIAKLPPVVTADDYSFLETLVTRLHSSSIADTLGAYYQNPTSPRRDNRRGAAATALVVSLHSSYVPDALRQLPGFVSEDDQALLAHLASNTHSSNVASMMGAYFTNPSSPRPGNTKGQLAIYISQRVHSSYVADVFKVLPGHVSSTDLTSVKRLVDGTHSSNLAQVIREYFGTL